MTAYRDDLEAAQLRATDLERELAELRDRNRKLEAEVAGGDTAEELANARRLAAAIEREKEEQHRQEQAELDARATQNAQRLAAASARAQKDVRLPRGPKMTRLDRWISSLLVVAILGPAAIGAFGVGAFGVAAITIVVIGALIGLIAARDASGGDQ